MYMLKNEIPEKKHKCTSSTFKITLNSDCELEIIRYGKDINNWSLKRKFVDFINDEVTDEELDRKLKMGSWGIALLRTAINRIIADSRKYENVREYFYDNHVTYTHEGIYKTLFENDFFAVRVYNDRFTIVNKILKEADYSIFNIPASKNDRQIETFKKDIVRRFVVVGNGTGTDTAFSEDFIKSCIMFAHQAVDLIMLKMTNYDRDVEKFYKNF